jgi:hypothetical protein
MVHKLTYDFGIHGVLNFGDAAWTHCNIHLLLH